MTGKLYEVQEMTVEKDKQSFIKQIIDRMGITSELYKRMKFKKR